MDIYYFYNGINNIINLFYKNPEKYNYGDLMIYRDPLVILELYDPEYINKPLSINQHGGLGVKAAVTAVAAAPPPLEGSGGAGSFASGKSLVNKDINIIDSLKFLIKCLMFLIIGFLLPLAPFIAISYYSFVKLKLYYDTKFKTL